MKRLTTILLTLVMICSCAYTVMAADYGARRAEYLNFDYNKKINVYPRVNVLNGNSIKNISLVLEGEYITKNGILMVPAVQILKEVGFDTVEYNSDTKTLTGFRTSDQREVALNCDKTAEGYYGFRIGGGDIIYGNTMIDPIVTKEIPYIAIKDLPKFTGDQVYVDVSKVTYYVALNKGVGVNSSITELPMAGTDENTIVYKYANEKPYQAYIVINEVIYNISETVRPRKVGWDVLFEAESFFEAIGANITWSNDKKVLTAKKNNRVMSVYYDGTDNLTYSMGVNKEQKKADVSLKFVDGIAMLHYMDIRWLIGGGSVHSSADTGDIVMFANDIIWNTPVETDNSNDDAVKIKVNGTRLTDAQAILKDGTTLLPIRSVGNALGATITWDNVIKTAIIEKDGIIIVAPIGEKFILVNGSTKAINMPPQIIDGKTYMPLRVIGEALNCNIKWVNETKTVEIN